MRNALKKIALSIPPVQRLQRNRDDLIERSLRVEAENLQLKEELKAFRSTPPLPKFDYDADGMKLWNKNLKSLNEPRFVAAYDLSIPPDIRIQYRAYICCWAASYAAKIPGDFVECGVNKGWLSQTICRYLDFNSLGKSFYLFDTFNGIPSEQITASEAERAALHHYPDCFEEARRSFSEFPKAKLVRGKIPGTLNDAVIEKVSYLSIDMNIEKPERDAIEFFWPKIVPGGVVVLDDYAFGGYEKQHDSMDEFAEKVGANILTLPTGQGLIVKS